MPERWCRLRRRRSGTNQAIGRRWPLLAWAFVPASYGAPGHHRTGPDSFEHTIERNIL